MSLLWRRLTSLRRHRSWYNLSTFSNPSRLNSTESSKSHIRVSKDIRTHFVFGANTDVGKTVVCAGLAQASLLADSTSTCHYIKPLQCGASDQAFVQYHVNHSSKLHSQNLFHWQTPTSPHAASRLEHQPTSDAEVLDKLTLVLTDISATKNGSEPLIPSTTTWIETAGGVLSPSSASPLNRSPRHASSTDATTSTANSSWGWTTQADLYQPLAGISQVVLVGDGRLGGISCTLSALESLTLRGYTVAAIVFLSSPPFDNVSAIREYASRYECRVFLSLTLTIMLFSGSQCIFRHG